MTDDDLPFELDAAGRAQLARAVARVWQFNDRSEPEISTRAEAIIRTEALAAESSKQLRTRWYERNGLRLLGLAGIAGSVIISIALLTAGDRVGPASRIYQTATGERANIRFSDGSTMILAPDTRVTMTAKGLTMTGEAQFTIAPHQTRPFIVHTSNAIVQVLGTTFTVRQYQSDRESRVVVGDGRVVVRTQPGPHVSQRQVVLSAHMLGRISDSAIAVTPNVGPDDYTNLIEGRLRFDETPLRDVVTELSRAYGIPIRLADSSLTNQPVTLAVSTRTESVTQILNFLMRAMDAHYTVSGKTFLIAAGRASGATPRPAQSPRSLHLPLPEPQYGR